MTSQRLLKYGRSVIGQHGTIAFLHLGILRQCSALRRIADQLKPPGCQISVRIYGRTFDRRSGQLCRLRTVPDRSVGPGLFRSYPFLSWPTGYDPDVSSRFIRKLPPPSKPIPPPLGASIVRRRRQPQISEMVPKLAKPPCRFPESFGGLEGIGQSAPACGAWHEF